MGSGNREKEGGVGLKVKGEGKIFWVFIFFKKSSIKKNKVQKGSACFYSHWLTCVPSCRYALLKDQKIKLELRNMHISLLSIIMCAFSYKF